MKWNHRFTYQFIFAVAGILIYLTGLQHNFTYLDDHVQVIDNPFIKTLNFDNIKEMFSNFFVGMYQPLTTLFYAATHSLFNLNPIAFHSLSLLFHLANGFLVYKILIRFIDSERITFILACIFLLHPMQVESVAWISAFSNLLFSFFFLFAFIIYLHYKSVKQSHYFALCFLTFVLACLAKSSAVVFPILLIGYDWFISKNISMKAILNKIPFIAISLVFGIITLIGRETAGHLSDLTSAFGNIDRIFLVCTSILFYPLKFIVPYSLSAFYPYPELINGSLPFEYYLSPFLLIGIAVIIYLKRKNNLLLFGIFWFMVAISLVLQFVPFGNQITTDRYIYLPIVGLLLAIGSLLMRVKNPNLVFLGFIPVLIFGFQSYQRTKIWENDETLWNSVIETHPNVSQAYNNLGSYSLKQNKTQQAFNYFNKAIAMQPNYADAYSNRGNILAQAGSSEAALENFSKAIELRPHADAYFNRANEYSKLNRLNEAIVDYSKSIELDLKADSYTNRAFAYLKLRKIDLALNDALQAIELDPNSNQAYFILGLIQRNMGNSREACSFYFKAMNMGNQNAKQAFNQACR